MSAKILAFTVRPTPVRWATIACEFCNSYVPGDPESTLEHLELCEAGETQSLTRADAIARIRAGLVKRSGKQWSVTGGKGTAYGWLCIDAPPKRRIAPYGYMSDADAAELKQLLNIDRVHPQGVKVMDSTDAYREYIARAEGRIPRKIAAPYWD